MLKRPCDRTAISQSVENRTSELARLLPPSPAGLWRSFQVRSVLFWSGLARREDTLCLCNRNYCR